MPKHKRTSNTPNLPIKVTRDRPLPGTITTKRYRRYTKEETKWSARLMYITEQWNTTEKKQGLLQQAADHLGVAYSTLCRYWGEWKDYIFRYGFTESVIAQIDTDNRSHEKRVFNEFEERQLYDRLVQEMDYNERGLTDSDIADIALAYWRELHPLGKNWVNNFLRVLVG